MKEANGWTKVPLAILEHPTLPWKAEWLWIALKWHSRPERPSCWPSFETLAEWSGLTEWDIRRAIAELERAGLLVIDRPRPGRRTNTYHLFIPAGRWLAVPNSLLADSSLKIEDKLLFAHLFKSLPEGRRRVFKDQTKLAEEMAKRIPEFTRRRVQLALDRLEANGYLTSEWPDRRGPKAYIYAPFLGGPPHLTGCDEAHGQEEHVHQGVSVRESAFLMPEDLCSHDGGDSRQDRGNGRRSLAGAGVHQASPDQDRAGLSPKAISPQGPRTSPRQSPQAAAPRTEAASCPQIDQSMCNSVQQDITERKGTKCSSGTSDSRQRILQLGGEGDSSSEKPLGLNKKESGAEDSRRKRLEGPLELEELPPPPDDPWRLPLPRYRARCARCGQKFEMIRFEVELRHTLCPRCRIEVVNSGEGWPGYGTPRPRRWRGGAGPARENAPGQEAIFSGAIGNRAPVHGFQ